MKKIILIFFVCFVAFSNSTAQVADSENYSYVRPIMKADTAYYTNTLSLGFGVGGYYPYRGLYYGDVPGITLNYEKTVIKQIGPGEVNLGGLVSYKRIYSDYSSTYSSYTYQQNWNYYIIGASLKYQMTDFSLLGFYPYAGVMAGYYITSFEFTSNDPNYLEATDPGNYLAHDNYPDFFAFSIFAGINSPIGNHANFWLETGYGYSTLAFGFSYRF